MNETTIILPSGVRERIPAAPRSLKTRLKEWLWKIGIIDLPIWEQPEVPMVRGEVLRAALSARRGE